jgi:hypothetical protein
VSIDVIRTSRGTRREIHNAVRRAAPKPAELFFGGGHDATVTFDKGNPNLRIEAIRRS